MAAEASNAANAHIANRIELVQINKNNMFHTLNNVQDVRRVASIFSNNKPIEELQKYVAPLFILLVGSPGAGKSHSIDNIISSKNLVPDSFYKVSLDSIVEHIAPYREATKRLHNTARKKHGHVPVGENIYKYPLPNDDYAILSEVYLTTIQSRNKQFGLPEKERRVTAKLNNPNIKFTPKKAIKAIKAIKGIKPVKDYKNLIECLYEGLKYGIDHGVNIIFDTTLDNTTTKDKNKLKDKIIPLLDKARVKYNILVVLVEAPLSDIKARLQKRHNINMIHKEKYLRAVAPKLIETHFIKDNQKGFDAIKKWYTEEKEQGINTYNIEFKRFFNIISPSNNKNAKLSRKPSSNATPIKRTLMRSLSSHKNKNNNNNNVSPISKKIKTKYTIRNNS